MDNPNKAVLVRMPPKLADEAKRLAERETQAKGRRVSVNEIITRSLRREVRGPEE